MIEHMYGWIGCFSLLGSIIVVIYGASRSGQVNGMMVVSWMQAVEECIQNCTGLKGLDIVMDCEGIVLKGAKAHLRHKSLLRLRCKVQHEVCAGAKTPDEDFGMLLEAAVMYDRRVAAILNEDDSTKEEVLWKETNSGKQFLYPRLLFIITGKGPNKEKYEEKIRRLKLNRVAFRTMWLSAEDYPLLLGSADLGICLHTSSSGLDLPMKVVDMFGCGLPVCAVPTPVEKNGLLFSSSSELANELLMLFKGFPDNCDALKLLRNGVVEAGFSARWDTEWERHAKPLISKASSFLF
ncbi:UDP-glycosyltransferase TURAN [Vitis vinifera]|uniref:UDP-glycosyltransferase TURAN n=1 Tax=Vitis vinifera TaxID=29760 RepID=A0A438KN00_VITVI|nr:UDP-glycosyltransferase TURAN [Vitis vinifera]